jgi:hypothetical protein
MRLAPGPSSESLHNIGHMPRLCGLLARPAGIQNIEHRVVGSSVVGTSGNRFRKDGPELGWSWELHDGWGVSGMFTEFFRPSDLRSKPITETTFVLEEKLTEELSPLTEYVGDNTDGAGPAFSWRGIPVQSQRPEFYCRRRAFVPLRWIVRKPSEMRRSA